MVRKVYEYIYVYVGDIYKMWWDQDVGSTDLWSYAEGQGTSP